jgi:hypothetical protein
MSGQVLAAFSRRSGVGRQTWIPMGGSELGKESAIMLALHSRILDNVN